MDHPRLRLFSAKSKKCILEMINAAQSGHPGGSLSCIDILTAIYNNKYFRHHPEEPNKIEDWFILSKGHAAPALYATLGQCGYFDKILNERNISLEEYFKTLRKLNSDLQGHPDMKKTQGVHFSTGVLGLGFPVASGIALGIKIDKKDYNVYAVIGDGEFQEGTNYEALLYAANKYLNNLCVFMDKNDRQIDGRVSEINSINPLYDKIKSYGWDVREIQGHNYYDLLSALDYFYEGKKYRTRPLMIIAYTIKDKPHGSPLKKEDYDKEIAFLDLKIREIEGVLNGN